MTTKNLISSRLSSNYSVGAAYFIARWILGISYFNAAIWKVFVLTPTGHYEKFFSSGFENTWIPTVFLMLLGYTIPFVELLIGILLCVGFRAREMALLSGLLLIVTTYGHSLMDPLYNISQGLTFSRVALSLFLLLIADQYDLLSVDKLIKYYKGKS